MDTSSSKPESKVFEDTQSLELEPLETTPVDIKIDSLDKESDKQPAPILDRRVGAAIEAQHRHEIQLEDNRFRHWMMKVLVVSFCFVLAVVMMAMTYSMLFQHQPMNESTLKTFLDTLTEILKVLKPPNSGNSG